MLVDKVNTFLQIFWIFSLSGNYASEEVQELIYSYLEWERRVEVWLMLVTLIQAYNHMMCVSVGHIKN